MNASEFTLYQTISRVARLNPEAPAIMAPGKKGLSYTRLGELIHLIHAQLNDLGVRRGDRVGVLLPSGAEMATTFLAVASCAVFAPINPRLPPRQLQTILAQIGPKVLIVTAETFLSLQEVTVEAGVLIVEMLPEIGGEAGWFCLRRHGGGVPLPQRLAPGVGGAEALPNDPAILLLSSGTTDRPKLTTLAHEPVCLSSIKAAGFLGLSKADRCLNALPLYHVYGLISGLLMPLAAGGSVVVLPTFNPRQFMDGMDEFRPTWYPGTPAMHQSVLDYMASSGRAPAVKSLRFIRSASAPIAPTLVEGLEEAFKVPVLVAYAMTEVPHIACNPVHRRKPNSVGISVLPEISIMGEDGYLLPRGAIGEVVVRGPAVCQGYETSQEALGTCGKEGWFHTGDLGWLDEDGYLFLTGRIKEIINRGGQKISPRELDEALLTHPDVREAVAFAVSHATLGEDIAAAVVPKDGRHLNEDELREFVARRLSDFKVPSRIVVVDEIPLGSTGKVQRLGLADKLANKLAVAYEHPAPGLEQLVAGVFQQTLRWPQAIGKNDNFFLLGGDSLRGMQAVAKLSDALALAIPPTTLFWKPTVAGLAKQLSTLHKDPSLPWTCLVPLQAKGSKPPFFFVHGWGGGVFFFSGLARLLDADQPSYGLQAIGWDNQQPRHLCVEDMAAHYAREIRACQPQGPYYLGGHSAGGWIAYATALELKRQGQPVAMLALLDTRPTVPLPWWVLWRGKTLYLMVRLWCHAKTFWQIKGQSRWKYFLGRLVALKNQIQQMRRHPVRASAPPTEARPSTPGLDYYAGRVRNYKPAVYDSLVDFFIAEDTGADQVSMLRHFLRGGINIHRVPGTHRDVLESHNLQAFSRVFAAALRKAQERARLSQPQ